MKTRKNRKQRKAKTITKVKVVEKETPVKRNNLKTIAYGLIIAGVCTLLGVVISVI